MTADLEQLNQIWFRAWLEKDVSVVEKLMAEDYLYIAPNGELMDRQAILNVIKSPSYHLHYGTFSEVEKRSLGEDAGVIVRRYRGEVSFEGKRFKEDHRCTMLCVRRDGQWRIALEHCSPNSA
jgi:uncharacterized protein (TIGR02246 family)